jgi:hypothetical protein
VAASRPQHTVAGESPPGLDLQKNAGTMVTAMGTPELQVLAISVTIVAAALKISESCIALFKKLRLCPPLSTAL